jgi:hypothetical protein
MSNIAGVRDLIINLNVRYASMSCISTDAGKLGLKHVQLLSSRFLQVICIIVYRVLHFNADSLHYLESGI